MKLNFFLIATPFVFLNQTHALTCDPRYFLLDMDYTSNQAQLGVTQFPYVVMLGGCDVQYGKFHADLALYSVTHDTYCQLYHTNPFLDDLVPSVGTLLDGSQHAFESAGDSLKINNDIYEWSDQNFSVDVNTIIMPCATYYYTDAVTGTPTPPRTTCKINATC